MLENNLEKCRYELNVEGMTCVKCTEKIERSLKGLISPIENLKIDFITNRVLFTSTVKASVEEANIKLKECGFKVIDSKDISISLRSDRRKLYIKILKGQHELITRELSQKQNLLIEPPQFIENKCMLVYNPATVRGSELVQKLRDAPQTKEGTFAFQIENFFEDNNHQVKFSEFSLLQVVLILSFNTLLVGASLIQNSKVKTAPETTGIFSYYFIAVFILTMLTLLVAGLRIYRISFKQLFKSRNVNMMTLVSIGSGLGLIFGLTYTIWGVVKMIAGNLNDPLYFITNGTGMYFTASTILTAVVVGKYLEGRIKKRVSDRVEDLKQQLNVNVNSVKRIIPKNRRFDILSIEDLPPALVEKDDYILIQDAGMIPFDGFIEKGSLKMVENFQYGWEKVETKTKGHPILSGSQVMHVQEPTIIRVTESIERTLAGRLFYEIKEAASGTSSEKARAADILSKVSKYFIIVIIVIAIITLLGWGIGLLTHSVKMDVTFTYPFEKAIAVLVASCPCALGIAIPMVYAIALRKGFNAGVLIKDTASLDVLHKIDTVVFDKTGTITGTYNIGEVQNITNKYDEASFWEMVLILEKNHIQHPIGLALFQEALQRLARLEKPKNVISKDEKGPKSHEFHASEGVVDKGITINGDTKVISLGNNKLLKRLGERKVETSHEDKVISLETPLLLNGQDIEINNHITINLWVEDELHFVVNLILEESLKSNVMELIAGLKKRKKDILILSGDNQASVNQIGEHLGIPLENIHGELAPEEKEQYIKDLIENHSQKVMMVGDGINDIKAFKAATLSCSINFKSSQNLTFSDFIIIDNDVENILRLFTLASTSNIFKILILIIALLYNIPTILVASGTFMEVAGIDLPAFMAAWAMVAFSVSLTLIANLMEFVKIKQNKQQQKKKKKKNNSSKSHIAPQLSVFP